MLRLGVYYVRMADKKRVNISIDASVHSEMQRVLEVGGMDFSGFIEVMCVKFLGTTRPIFKRLEAAKKGESDLTPAEVRVMFLEMFGAVQIDAGAQVQNILTELATLEADLEKKEVYVLTDKGRSEEVIHTPKVRKNTRAKK